MGTFRTNRKGWPKEALIISAKASRGTFKVMKRVQPNQPDLFAVCFKDTKVVSMLTSIPPTRTAVIKWSKQLRSRVSITYPSTKVIYDNTMYGCDLTGQLCSSLQLKNRTRKWTQTIILGKLRQAIASQARTLYNIRFDKKISVLDFAAKLLMEMEENIGKRNQDHIQRNSPNRRKRRMSGLIATPTSKRRVIASEDMFEKAQATSFDHWPCRSEKFVGDARRCRVCYAFGSIKKTTMFCQTCKVFLCIPHADSDERDCFKFYHVNAKSFRLQIEKNKKKK